MPPARSPGASCCWSSAVEDAGLDQSLGGDIPTLVRMDLVEGVQLGTDLGAVAGVGQRLDLADELLGVGRRVHCLTRGEVTDVRVLAAVEGDQVLELAEDAQGTAGGVGAGADRSARGLGLVAGHAWYSLQDRGGTSRRGLLRTWDVEHRERPSGYTSAARIVPESSVAAHSGTRHVPANRFCRLYPSGNPQPAGATTSDTVMMEIANADVPRGVWVAGEGVPQTTGRSTCRRVALFTFTRARPPCARTSSGLFRVSSPRRCGCSGPPSRQTRRRSAPSARGPDGAAPERSWRPVCGSGR